MNWDKELGGKHTKEAYSTVFEKVEQSGDVPAMLELFRHRTFAPQRLRTVLKYCACCYCASKEHPSSVFVARYLESSR